ncbi:unnamed protein product [Vicia faba]|uniref:Uncharacterized protein n=1 Tax=Vicia faba TaxID=3906 RepID=A0AAV0YWG2_VICFA|nr:unnamed protein product [Vicia faba]
MECMVSELRNVVQYKREGGKRVLAFLPKPQMELEDRFIMSSSFLDSEVTENTQSEESLKESEDVSSDETVKQEESLIILLLSIAFVSISLRVSRD